MGSTLDCFNGVERESREEVDQHHERLFEESRRIYGERRGSEEGDRGRGWVVGKERWREEVRWGGRGGERRDGHRCGGCTRQK